MAVRRTTLDQIRKRKPSVDRARLDATTDAEIARQIAADPDTAPGMGAAGPRAVRRIPLLPVARIRSIRARTGLTQAKAFTSSSAPTHLLSS